MCRFLNFYVAIVMIKFNGVTDDMLTLMLQILQICESMTLEINQVKLDFFLDIAKANYQ